MLFARYGQGLLVLHERQTRFNIVQRPVDRKAVRTASTIARQLGKLPQAMRKTISFDNGTEFAEHHRLHKALGVQTFFCDPHSPWQKGGVENSIGRLRRSPATQNRPQLHHRSRPQAATFSASTTPHANAWTSRHPPRHSPNSNQPLHFKRDSTSPPSRGRHEIFSASCPKTPASAGAARRSGTTVRTRRSRG